MIGLPEAIGPFEVLGEIGRGGMGVVYLARQPSLDRLVAVKVLGVRDPELSERLRREAEVLSELQHPHIVSVLDVGEEHGDPYYAMTYCSGGSIAKVLERDGRLSSGQATTVLGAVSEALAALHARGFVHRDVKPSNVLLSGDGDPYLGDFGLALSGDVSRVTTSGAVLGTIGYSAPELLEDAAASPQSDVFSLGVLGYQMLSGQLPFRGAHLVSVLDAVRAGRYAPLAEVAPEAPAPLAALVERAMAVVPTDRPDDLWQLARDFRAAAPEERIVPIREELDQGATLRRAGHAADDTVAGGRHARVRTSGPDDKPGLRAKRTRTLTFAAIVVAALVAVAIAAHLSESDNKGAAAGPTTPALTVSATHAYQLDAFDFPNHVTATEVWTVIGPDSRTLRSTITIRNLSNSRIVQTQDVVIPKSLARSVRDVLFTSVPTSTVNPDPIVRYCLTLDAHAQLVLTYTTTPSVSGAIPSHLASWAAEWRRETDDDFASHVGAPCKGAPKRTVAPRRDASHTGLMTIPRGSAESGFISTTTVEARTTPPKTLSATAPSDTKPPTKRPSTSPPTSKPPTTKPPTTIPITTPTMVVPTTPPVTVPPTVPLKIGDINGDGVVGCKDLAIMDSEWGQTGSNLPADLSHDGTVGIADLSILASHWDDPAAASGNACPQG